MGTDVHAVFQARKNGKWEDVASTWEQNRHYFLFAWLAGVRNGRGFAGVPTHAAIEPLAEPRGLPEDFEGGKEHPTTLDALAPRRREYEEDKEHPVAWMGDHSFSWLTADEILSTSPPGNVWHTGIVDRAFFDAWDGRTPPTEWSGGITGRDVRVAVSPVDVASDTTHVRIYWLQPNDELRYFTDEVRRLKAEHGEVRLVFGFDS